MVNKRDKRFMSEPHEPTANTSARYEQSHLSLGRLLAFGAGVVALIVMGVVGSWVAFHFFVEHEPLGPPASPFENVRQIPPSPRLQVNAPGDLQHYHASQDRILDSYGWVDQPTGVVRIPIDRAMRLLLQKGFPQQGTAAGKGQLHTPGAQPPPHGLVAPTPVAGEEVQ